MPQRPGAAGRDAVDDRALQARMRRVIVQPAYDNEEIWMRHLRWIAFVLMTTTASVAMAATEVDGVRVDDEATVAAQKLVLNGAGIRTRLLFKVYVAALYLPQKKDNTKDILALPGAKRVTVTMLREVSSDELGQALVTGIRKNATPEETRRFAPQMASMSDIFARIPKLKKGEFFSVDWIPGSGTVVVVDGKPVADPISDQAFYDTILKIWLGDEPTDSALKTAMLGAK